MKYALLFAASRFGACQFEIDERSMERAIAFDEYNNKIFQWLTKNELAENKEEYGEKKLIRYIKSRRLTELSPKLICDVLRKETKQTRDTIVSSLCSRGILERSVEISGETNQKRSGFTVRWEEID